MHCRYLRVRTIRNFLSKQHRKSSSSRCSRISTAVSSCLFCILPWIQKKSLDIESGRCVQDTTPDFELKNPSPSENVGLSGSEVGLNCTLHDELKESEDDLVSMNSKSGLQEIVSDQNEKGNKVLDSENFGWMGGKFCTNASDNDLKSARNSSNVLQKTNDFSEEGDFERCKEKDLLEKKKRTRSIFNDKRNTQYKVQTISLCFITL